jgi:hemerythrin
MTKHKEFFSRINAIFAATLKGEARKATMKEMRFLHKYAIYHFRTEEEIMKRYAYPDYRTHIEQHDIFFGSLAEIQNELEENGHSSSVVLRINAKLVNWLIDHIMKTDKKLGGYIKSL